MTSYLANLPLPDLVLREGDVDPVDLTLTQSDGVTPVNLTNRIVEYRALPLRGTQTALVLRSDGASPRIAIVAPATAGRIRMTPEGFLALAECYRGYFATYANSTPTSNPSAVPQPRDYWVQVLAQVA